MKILSEYRKKLISFSIEAEHELGFKPHPDRLELSGSKSYIAIITASQDEFNSVIKIIENVSEMNYSDDDTTIYYQGLIKTKYKNFSVILPVPNNIGIESTIITTTKLLNNFDINYVFMVGITAGNKNITKIGDIIVAEKSLNYDKVVEIQKEDNAKRTKFMQDSVKIHDHLKTRFDLFANSGEIGKISSSYQNKKKINHELSCHIGLLATGNSLLRSDSKIDEITRTYHGVKGLDMETSGFYYAISNVSKIKSPYFASIKSVSDFGDSTKHKLSGKERKDYALFTSSTALLNFIKIYLK